MFTEAVQKSFSNISQIISDLIGSLSVWVSSNDTELIGVAIIIFLAYLFGIILASLIRRSFLATGKSITLSFFISWATRVVIFVIGLLLSSYILGLTQSTTSLLAGLGILSFAFGLAIQDTIRDLLAGLFIILKQPFSDGDLIKGDGYYGEVIKTDMRSTRLRTFDGQIVTIPNKNLFNNAVENFTMNKRRRLNINIGCSSLNDISAIKDLVLGVFKKVKHIADTPKPKIVIVKVSDEETVFHVKAWLDKTSETVYQEVSDQVITEIKKVFVAKSVIVPFEISAKVITVDKEK